jgi:Raf kinase inhibitor-like YbhB/YbcL family protein
MFKEVIMALTLSSPVFSQNGEIPKSFTCDGTDVSPPLEWSGIPPQTKSLVLIIDDPDAPDPEHPLTTWVHWVVYNLPPSATGLNEGVRRQELPLGTLEGENDWKQIGYGGPCPPTGRHRYFHKLYALDKMLPDLKSPTKKQVEEAMEGHIIDSVELVGTYAH